MLVGVIMLGTDDTIKNDLGGGGSLSNRSMSLHAYHS